MFLEEAMKRTLCFILVLLMLILPVCAAVPTPSEAAPILSAQGVAVYDQQSGEFVYDKNIDGSVPAAFTVKLMTVYLAMQSLSLNDTVVIPDGFLENVTAHSGLNFTIGEEVTVRDLCYCILVKNANDACNILALATGKTLEEFVGSMNQTAKELGMTSTHFADTHGESKDAYTTPRDAVKLITEFCKNEELMQISNTTFYRMPATNKSKKREMYSSNLFINAGSKYYYSRAVGIKLELDKQRGYCSATYCEFNNMQLICVAFNGGQDAGVYYGQLQNLLEWVRTQYKRVSVLSAGTPCGSSKVILCRSTDTVMLVSGEAFSYIVPADYDKELITLSVQAPEQVEAPITEGDELGEATILYDGEPIGKVKVLAGQTVQRDAGMTIRYRLGQLFSHPIVTALIIIVIIGAVVYLGYMRAYIKKKKKKGKK